MNENLCHTPVEYVKETDRYGKLDLVIAFDTTGSMAVYIDEIREKVATMIPMLFKDNEDLKIGIVAFGDYCDMAGEDFGNAYQCHKLSSNKHKLICFVKDSKNTCGGDADEFYELVIRKIVNETDWRPGATRSVLLIGDSTPHPPTHAYHINWREEARMAAEKKVRFDTVAIHNQRWMHELSKITGGRVIPTKTTAHMVPIIVASVLSRGSSFARAKYDSMLATASPSLSAILKAYEADRKG